MACRLDYLDVLDYLDRTGLANDTALPTVTAAHGYGYGPGKDAPEDLELATEGAVGLADREFVVRLRRAILWRPLAGSWLMLAVTVAGP